MMSAQIQEGIIGRNRHYGHTQYRGQSVTQERGLSEINEKESYVKMVPNLSFVNKEISPVKTFNRYMSYGMRNLKLKKKEEIRIYDKIYKRTRNKDFINKDNINKEYKEPSNNFPKLDTKIIEEWINTTLKDVQAYIIPKEFLNKSGKTALGNFGIDRDKLLVVLYKIIGLLLQ